MRDIRSSLSTILAIGLVAGSAGAVAAQDGAEAGAPTWSRATSSTPRPVRVLTSCGRATLAQQALRVRARVIDRFSDPRLVARCPLRNKDVYRDGQRGRLGDATAILERRGRVAWHRPPSSLRGRRAPVGGQGAGKTGHRHRQGGYRGPLGHPRQDESRRPPTRPRSSSVPGGVPSLLVGSVCQ